MANRDDNQLDVTSPDEFELTHHGIKGQKWGVRRESPSGSSGGHSSVFSKFQTKTSKHNAQIHANAKTLSNDELKTAIARIKLEREYITLSRKDSSVQLGVKTTKNILKNKGTLKLVSAPVAVGAKLAIGAVKGPYFGSLVPFSN